jgi:hypothetical protein
MTTRKTVRASLPLASIATLVVGIAGCAAPTEGSETTQTTPEVEQALLADHAVTLDGSELANAAVHDDEIVFASPSDAVRALQPGTTISTATTDLAFIRTIKSVETDEATGGVKIKTQQGALSHLVKRITASKHLALPVVNADMSGKILAGDARANISCSECYVRYSPTLDVAFDIDEGRVKSFRAEFDGDLVGRLAVAATADGTAQIGKEIEIAGFTTRLVQMIGVVPIWEDVTVSVVVGASASLGPKTALETGVTATKRMHGGVVYDGSTWSTVHDGDVTFTEEAPKLTLDVGAHAAIYLKPKVQVKLYSLAGPYLAAGAELDFDANVCPPPAEWSAKAGFVVDVGASLDFVSFVHLSVDKELYRKEWPLASGALPVPNVCGG